MYGKNRIFNFYKKVKRSTLNYIALRDRYKSFKSFHQLASKFLGKKFVNAGFTLIEIIVVIAITALIGGIGLASFSSYSNVQEANQTALDIKQMLDEARLSTISNKKPHYNPADGSYNPDLCIFDTDGSGGINSPGEGVTASFTPTPASELIGYRVRLVLSGGLWRARLFVVCRQISPSTTRAIRIKEKVLSAKITIPTDPCSSTNYYEFTVPFAAFTCSSSLVPPPSSPYEITVRRTSPGTIDKIIRIDQYGKDIRIL